MEMAEIKLTVWNIKKINFPKKILEGSHIIMAAEAFMLPAVTQGTPTLECRRKDEYTHHRLGVFILIGAQIELRVMS